jgi:hypothetical protein
VGKKRPALGASFSGSLSELIYRHLPLPSIDALAGVLISPVDARPSTSKQPRHRLNSTGGTAQGSRRLCTAQSLTTARKYCPQKRCVPQCTERYTMDDSVRSTFACARARVILTSDCTAKRCPLTATYFSSWPRSACTTARTGRKLYLVCLFVPRTGHPIGTGLGGRPAWSGSLKDELHSSLVHDAAGVISMSCWRDKHVEML